MKLKKQPLAIFLFIALTVFSTSFISCSKDDDSGGDEESSFAGLWSGTYTGDDAGTFQANINSQGSITGNIVSSVTGESYTLSGSVSSDGDFSASIGSASSGAEFEGSI